LGFFTKELPAEWAFLFIERVAKKDREKHPMPWGTWDEFTAELEVVFGDPNEERNELTKLENLTMKTGQTATEFFQEFDLYALHADYMKDDKVLIRMAEKKVPKHLVRSIFYRGKPPTEYSKWKQAIIDADNIEREFHDATSHHPTTAASSSKDATAAHDKTRSNQDRNRRVRTRRNLSSSFANPPRPTPNRWALHSRSQRERVSSAGKKDTGRKIVLNRKNIVQLRAQISSLTEAELDCLNESSF